VSYLTSPETDAVLAAPDRTTWYGRRDHALLLTAVQTGLRVSEVTGLTIQDITTTTPSAAVHTTGKGRKERATPLTRQTPAVLRAWLPEAGSAPGGPAFPTRRGTRLSADAVQRLVAKHAAAAALSCPSLSSKRVTPHTLRHTAAMTLLHTGVDTSVIALWLGYQSPVTTHIYLHADMTIKERALARVPERTPSPAATGPLTTSSTSSKDYEYQAHHRGYAAPATPSKPTEQHEQHHRHHGIGITGSSA
jgi:integrase